MSTDRHNARTLDKDEVQAWSAGWQRTAAVLVEERRTIPLSLRFRQLDVLHNLAVELGLAIDREDASSVQVRERWVRLKRTCS